MLERCLNPETESYKNYGGRGITVCQRWLDSFDNFMEDLGPKKGRRLTIERINNNGNYEPLNCVWATYREQGRNKRNTIKVLFNGRTVALLDALEQLNIHNPARQNSIRSRMRRGMSFAQAVGFYFPYRVEPKPKKEKARRQKISSALRKSWKKRKATVLQKHQDLCEHSRTIGLDGGWYCLDCASRGLPEPLKNL